MKERKEGKERTERKENANGSVQSRNMEYGIWDMGYGISFRLRGVE